MSNNSESERKGLIERYARMPTGQLQQIAAEPHSLTDVARILLEEELHRRTDISDLPTPQETQPDNVTSAKLVVVRSYLNLLDALLAKGSLETAGIESFLADENMVRLDWFISNALGGVKIMVRDEDVADAIAVLDQPMPETFTVDGIGEYKQPHCPECGSLDVSFGAQPLIYNDPAALPVQSWYCQNCSHTWVDPGEDVSST
jgi:Putative prokaryotic signal transducing protein